MVSAMTPNPEHLDWLREHGIDPERTVSPVQITAAPTREHPRRVIVDYETVHRGEGGVHGRTRGQIIANEPPPPGWLLPRPESVDDELTALRAKVARVEALHAEWRAAIEPDGSTSFAPVRYMAAELGAALAEGGDRG